MKRAPVKYLFHRISAFLKTEKRPSVSRFLSLPSERPMPTDRASIFLSAIVLCAALLTGCASTAVIQNEAVEEVPELGSYSLKQVYGNRSETGVSLVLAFSGGGARAAALAYGVMLELRDTQVIVEGQGRALLEDVKVISAVSGGSFTAAYYGLYGDAIFNRFEEDVLEQDLETEITRRVLSLSHLLSNNSRGEAASQVYSEHLFGDRTFADMRTKNAPLILINASDLSSGARISFVQDFFSLLCSDIDSFPIAKAVAASAGVPLLFEPVVLENFDTCDVTPALERLQQAADEFNGSQMELAVQSIAKLANEKQTHRYLHLVDGGITDNLGLRSIYELVELYGGIEAFMEIMGRTADSRSVLISVDAAVDSSFGIGQVPDEPSVEQSINAVTDIQLHRYNASTLELMRNEFGRWHRELSTSGRAVEPYFIDVALADYPDPDKVAEFNRIPTTLNLSDLQVDALIEAGRSLLRTHPEFQRLLADLK